MSDVPRKPLFSINLGRYFVYGACVLYVLRVCGMCVYAYT